MTITASSGLASSAAKSEPAVNESWMAPSLVVAVVTLDAEAGLTESGTDSSSVASGVTFNEIVVIGGATSVAPVSTRAKE